MLLVNGDLPREMPFTEKSSRNTFIIGAVHLLSITYKMCQIMCFYINTHLLSTEPFSFCDMVPPLVYILDINEKSNWFSKGKKTGTNDRALSVIFEFLWRLCVVFRELRVLEILI